MEVFQNEYRCLVGEGPIWDYDNKKLFFLDILGECIFIAEYPFGKLQKIDVGQKVGCMGLCENGDILLGMEDGVYRLDSKGDIKLAHKPAKVKGSRFNDGKEINDALINTISTYGENNPKFIYVSNGGEESINYANYIKCQEKGIDIAYTEIRNEEELAAFKAMGALKYCKYVATRYELY